MHTRALFVFLIASLSSVVVDAAPAASGPYSSNVYTVSHPNANPAANPVASPNLGAAAVLASPELVARSPEPEPDHTPTLQRFRVSHKLGPRALLKKAFDAMTAGGNAYTGSSGDTSGGGPSWLTKRTNDTGTLGGNAHTGNSGAVDGGDIVNAADNFGTPTLLNIHSNNGGAGGGSLSGCATGGVGDAARGAGGNAGSGTAGSAHGGSVWNSGAVANFYSNNAGDAGFSKTGCATGGDVRGVAEQAEEGPSEAEDEPHSLHSPKIPNRPGFPGAPEAPQPPDFQ